jgi:hypothetical protein
MRLLFVSLAVAAMFAASDQAHAKKYRNSYSACYCDFGYPEHRCMPVVSCYDDGGRCGKSCPRQAVTK